MGFGFFVQNILMGIGLAMDAFSVSVANGLNEPCMKKGKMLGIAGMFAFFQALILGHFYAPRKTVAQHMVAETIERRSYENAKKAAADKEKNEQN